MSGSSSPAPFIRGSEPTEEALDIYAELTGRTVLRPGKLPQLPVSIKPDLPTDTNAAIARVVSELAQCHLEVVSDGETFVRVLPQGWQNSLTGKQLAQITPARPVHMPQILFFTTLSFAQTSRPVLTFTPNCGGEPFFIPWRFPGLLFRSALTSRLRRKKRFTRLRSCWL